MICKKCKHYKPEADLKYGGWCDWVIPHRYKVPACMADSKRVFATDSWKKCPTFEAKAKEAQP